MKSFLNSLRELVKLEEWMKKSCLLLKDQKTKKFQECLYFNKTVEQIYASDCKKAYNFNIFQLESSKGRHIRSVKYIVKKSDKMINKKLYRYYKCESKLGKIRSNNVDWFQNNR